MRFLAQLRTTKVDTLNSEKEIYGEELKSRNFKIFMERNFP